MLSACWDTRSVAEIEFRSPFIVKHRHDEVAWHRRRQTRDGREAHRAFGRIYQVGLDSVMPIVAMPSALIPVVPIVTVLVTMIMSAVVSQPRPDTRRRTLSLHHPVAEMYPQRIDGLRVRERVGVQDTGAEVVAGAIGRSKQATGEAGVEATRATAMGRTRNIVATDIFR